MDTLQANAFHPYKILRQGHTSLQLDPPSRQKTLLLILRLAPLLPAVIGIVLFFMEKKILFLLLFGGVFLIEMLVLSLISLLAGVTMDSLGFTLETISIRGISERYILWNDVDRIRYRSIHVKNSHTLAYDAMLNTGKKIRFLQFPNYHRVKARIPEINVVLHQISGRNVQEK